MSKKILSKTIFYVGDDFYKHKEEYPLVLDPEMSLPVLTVNPEQLKKYLEDLDQMTMWERFKFKCRYIIKDIKDEANTLFRR